MTISELANSLMNVCKTAGGDDFESRIWEGMKQCLGYKDSGKGIFCRIKSRDWVSSKWGSI